MFAELCDHLYRFHTERKAALKDRDEKREQDPEWFKKTYMLGMMPFLDTPKVVPMAVMQLRISGRSVRISVRWLILQSWQICAMRRA